MVDIKELHNRFEHGKMIQTGGASMDEVKVVKSFRIPPTLWEKFQAKAKKDGYKATELLNMLVEAYVREDVKIGWSIRPH